jgi:reactive intermediate/imine deaminase
MVQDRARRSPGGGADVTDPEQIRLDPDPLEPYYLSQGFRVGDLVIVSGQAALDEHGAIVGVGDFDAQAEQTFRNLARVLEAGGASLDRVVKVTIFLTDMGNFPKIVELRKRWFSAPYPADTIVEVRSLALPELEIEIEAIAVAHAGG